MLYGETAKSFESENMRSPSIHQCSKGETPGDFITSTAKYSFPTIETNYSASETSV